MVSELVAFPRGKPSIVPEIEALRALCGEFLKLAFIATGELSYYGLGLRAPISSESSVVRTKFAFLAHSFGLIDNELFLDSCCREGIIIAIFSISMLTLSGGAVASNKLVFVAEYFNVGG